MATGKKEAITIKDVAKEAGISYATVSRAFNNGTEISEKTRKHVLKIAAEMGYQPNGIARSLVNKQSKTIALIVPDISNPFFADIALATIAEANKRGYNTLLCNTGWDAENEQKQIDLVLEKRVDGIILKPDDVSKFDFEKITVPVVLFSYRNSGHVASIEVENEKGGFLACEHLIKCGYKRIAAVSGAKASQSNSMRVSGYKSALVKYGMQVDESLISYGQFTIESGYQNTGRMLERQDRPDAFFCGNDLIALGVYQSVVSKGLLVPEDIGIVGFDDVYFASFPQTQLTTIAQPRKVMGELAAQMLIDRIENPEKDLVRNYVLPAELVIRSSSRKL